MLAMAVAYRRSFCGNLCPLGALQGLFGAAGRRLLRRRLTVPRAVDRVARYLKYAVLVFFALWTWQAAELVLRPYDPWVAWAHLTSPDLLTSYGIGLAVLDRLAGRLARVRALLLQVPLPRRRPARAPVEGELPEHPPRRGRLHRLRPLRQGLHDERRGGDRRRGHQLRVHLLQRVRQRLPRARRPEGDGPRRRPRHGARRDRRGGGADGRPSSASPRSPARSTGGWRAGPRPAAPGTGGGEGQGQGEGQAEAAATRRSRAGCPSPTSPR